MINTTNNSKNKKTNRTNKTNLQLKFLNGYFTTKQMLKNNPDFVPITLRVHMQNSIEEGLIAEIGTLHNGKGRPQKIYTTVPVSNNVLEAALKAGVQLGEQYNTISVVDVDTNSISMEEPVVADMPEHVNA
jgi:hypothetical protein